MSEVKKRANISVCVIVRDNPFIEECLKSIRDYVEEIVVVDTGSTDNTVECAKKYADIVETYTGCNDPESGFILDFSNARQRSFDLATQPWVGWIDSDDLVAGADKLLSLIARAESLKAPGTDAVCFLFPYEYSYDAFGNCTLVHYRERLVEKKECFHWVNWVHEVLVPVAGKNVSFHTTDEIVIQHKRQYLVPNPNKKPDPQRNLRILKKFVEKFGTDDARQLYYLGLEYFNINQLDEAEKVLTQYIEASGWDDEKNMACLKMVEVCERRGNVKEGIKWGFKAIETKENWCEGYFALAKMFYYMAQQGGPTELRNWERCVYFAKLGLSLPPTKTLLFVNPFDREYSIHLYLNLALNKLGDCVGALNSCNIGLKKVPNDGMLLTNKKMYEAFLSRHEATLSTNKLLDIGEIDRESYNLILAMLNKQATHESLNATSKSLALTEDQFIVSTNWKFEDLPEPLSIKQLQTLVIMIWKRYMLYDQIKEAILFLENVPSEIKDTEETKKALELSRGLM
jgi:glycosyltransferase involved in cell wall biosynthesis